MNGKKAKRLRKHATQLLIRWIRSMTPDGEDATKITAKNLHEFYQKILTYSLIINTWLVLILLDGFTKK